MPRDLFRSDEEIDELLSHDNNGAKTKNNSTVKIKNIGSGNHLNHDHGDKKSGDHSQVRGAAEQAKIAVLAEVVGNKAASEMTGVGETQVSQHKNGKNSNNDISTELVNNTTGKLNYLSDKASDKVDLFLNMLSSDKIEDMKPKDIATAAGKMTDIAMKLKTRSPNPFGPDGGHGRPQIHFYAPVQLNVEEYITKEV